MNKDDLTIPKDVLESLNTLSTDSAREGVLVSLMMVQGIKYIDTMDRLEKGLERLFAVAKILDKETETHKPILDHKNLERAIELLAAAKEAYINIVK